MRKFNFTSFQLKFIDSSWLWIWNYIYIFADTQSVEYCIASLERKTIAKKEEKFPCKKHIKHIYITFNIPIKVLIFFVNTSLNFIYMNKYSSFILLVWLNKCLKLYTKQLIIIINIFLNLFHWLLTCSWHLFISFKYLIWMLNETIY